MPGFFRRQKKMKEKNKELLDQLAEAAEVCDARATASNDVVFDELSKLFWLMHNKLRKEDKTIQLLKDLIKKER